MTGRMDVIKGYRYGAPLAVTQDTLIREYASRSTQQHPRSLAGPVIPGRLWVADMLLRQPDRGGCRDGYEQRRHCRIPTDVLRGAASTIFRGDDDAIWLSPLSERNGHHRTPGSQHSKDWQTWVLRT